MPAPRRPSLARSLLAAVACGVVLGGALHLVDAWRFGVLMSLGVETCALGGWLLIAGSVVRSGGRSAMWFVVGLLPASWFFLVRLETLPLWFRASLTCTAWGWLCVEALRVGLDAGQPAVARVRVQFAVAATLAPILAAVLTRATLAPTMARADRIAQALSDHLRDHGRYPATLEELVPDHLEAVPRPSVHFGARGFGYVRSDDPDGFRLWIWGERWVRTSFRWEHRS